MSSRNLHLWTLDPKEAIIIQTELRERLVLSWDRRKVNTIAGVDVGFKDQEARAAIVVSSYPDLTPIESATAEKAIKFPYVPGLLTFREGPVIVAACRKLRTKPDLLLFDGQGIAHPRGFGLASHFGLITDKPTIGCAKSRLIGDYEEMDPEKGSYSSLYIKERKVGVVLRSRDKCKPVFISPGYLLSRF